MVEFCPYPQPFLKIAFLSRGTHRLLEAALATSADSAAEHLQPSSGYAPQYVEFKEQIGGEMAAIDRKMTELRQLHGRAALTSFDDTNSNEVEIEVITQEITRLFRKCEVRLQKFGSGKSTSEADEKVCLATHLSLMSQSDASPQLSTGRLTKLS